jgi:flagellin
MIYQSKIHLHNQTLTRATERLATGSRINNAKDDPFGNYEAENAASKLRNSEKAKQNSTDGAAFLQIAEGTCGEVQNILQRIRELSVQSANDTLSSTERHYLNIEANGLLQEIDRITAGTTFNTKQIFGDKGDSFSDETRDLVHIERDEYGNLINVVKDEGGNPILDKNGNPIRDKSQDWTPFAGYPSRVGILHIGPSVNPGKYHDVNEVKVSIPELSSKNLGIDTLSITYQNGASKAIDDLDSAISSLGTIRSYMGSLVNRMDNQVEDLEERNITVNDHISKIKDADYAKESTTLLTAQIQQQAALSMLAQSNSRVSRVLEILGR